MSIVATGLAFLARVLKRKKDLKRQKELSAPVMFCEEGSSDDGFVLPAIMSQEVILAILQGFLVYPTSQGFRIACHQYPQNEALIDRLVTSLGDPRSHSLRSALTGFVKQIEEYAGDYDNISENVIRYCETRFWEDLERRRFATATRTRLATDRATDANESAIRYIVADASMAAKERNDVMRALPGAVETSPEEHALFRLMASGKGGPTSSV